MASSSRTFDSRDLALSVGAATLLFAAALVTVYVVLGMLYESLIHPLTILSTLPSAGVGALLALMLFALFPRVILGLDSFVYRDYGVLAYPVIQHARDSFWRGELPLWNPLSNCGAPFLAQWGTMTLYPFSIVYLLFPLPNQKIANPIPVPGYCAFVCSRRNTTKICCKCSGAIPIPSSRTAKR